jgi:hypothetical protein
MTTSFLGKKEINQPFVTDYRNYLEKAQKSFDDLEEIWLFKIDGIVKSQKSSHSREGGNP